MAVISQQPNEFGLAVGPNVWVLNTLGNGNRFVLAVEINGQLQATLKQTPNPAGRGIFDINLILQSYLASPFIEQTQRFAQTPGGAIRYRIRFGIEIGTAITWNGYSSYKVVFNGYKDFNDLNWNQYGNYIAYNEIFVCEEIDLYSSCPIAEVNFLTSYPLTVDTPGVAGVPAQRIAASTDNAENEWATLSFANFSQQAFNGQDLRNRTPWAVVIKYYDSAGAEYTKRAYTLTTANGMALRANCNSNVAALTDTYLMGTIGTGPKNLVAAGLWPNGTVPAYYTIELWSRDCTFTVPNCANLNDIIAATNCLIAIHAYVVDIPCSKFEPMRLSFLNQFGGRDYFTFTKRNTYTENISRNNYFRDAGTWSGTSYTINSHERGTQTFNSTVTANMLVSTDWVEDDLAQWLEILYTSPEVKMFYNNEWIAVTLTSTSYQQKTVARDDKMFRYELLLEFSQPQTRQRG